MKICAYLTICLCLPFVLLAENENVEKAKPTPDENEEVEGTVTDPGFERFKTILDRMPFGRPPPGFNPDEPGGPADGRHGSAEEVDAATAEASEVEQQIHSSVTVSMLNRTADGKVFVGFTDSSVQPAKNYLLELGEKREQCEWQVVGADPDNSQVTLSKGGVEATLKVGGGSKSSGDKEGGKAKDGENGKPGMRNGLVRKPSLPTPPGEGAETGAGGKLTGLDIARARREARLAKLQAEEQQKRQAAEQAEKEREQARKEREQEKMEREMAAEERKEQLAQLMQIQEELRRQRAEKEELRTAAEGAQHENGGQPVEE